MSETRKLPVIPHEVSPKEKENFRYTNLFTPDMDTDVIITYVERLMEQRTEPVWFCLSELLRNAMMNEIRTLLDHHDTRVREVAQQFLDIGKETK